MTYSQGNSNKTPPPLLRTPHLSGQISETGGGGVSKNRILKKKLGEKMWEKKIF